MAYAFIQDVPLDVALYRKIMENIGDKPLEGLILHMVTAEGGGLRYTDVWESEELCAKAFEERIHPAVARAFVALGMPMPPEPTATPLDLIDLRGRAVPLA